MSSCVLARSGSPVGDEHECMDMVQPLESDRSLPLISTTPHMMPVIKTTDRPVVLYMAPVHKSPKDTMEDTMQQFSNVDIQNTILGPHEK